MLLLAVSYGEERVSTMCFRLSNVAKIATSCIFTLDAVATAHNLFRSGSITAYSLCARENSSSVERLWPWLYDWSPQVEITPAPIGHTWMYVLIEIKSSRAQSQFAISFSDLSCSPNTRLLLFILYPLSNWRCLGTITAHDCSSQIFLTVLHYVASYDYYADA